MDSSDCHSIGCLKIVNHICSCSFISMIEDIFLWVHVPLNLVDFVSSVRSIVGHDNSTFKLSIDKVHVVAVTTFLYES